MWNVDEAASADGAPFRGLSYGVSPHAAAGSDDADLELQDSCYADVTYVTTLGYDCVGCVRRLADPVVCP